MKTKNRPLVALSMLAATAAVAADKPNLVVIHTDEHNFRTLGCYRETLSKEQALMWGEAVVETPHIDRIAKEGAICTSYYATTPVCGPSRGTMFSGMYPQNSGVVKNNEHLKDEVVTFAEMLRRNGYATGYAGKWHLDEGKPGWAPEQKFGFEDNRFMMNRGHWKLLKFTDGKPDVGRDKKGEPSYKPIGNKKTFTTDWLADRTMEFIEKNKDKPFCYFVSIPDPHGPDTVRAPYNKMYDHQTYTKPRNVPEDDSTQPNWGKIENENYEQSKYYGMVKCIDDNVGRIFKKLEDLDILDNTIFIFTSDHGDMRGEHGQQNKGQPFEASAKCPFVIRWPSKIKAGTRIDEVIATVDFQPTILSMMGVPASGQEEGRDTSALLLNGEAPEGWEDVNFVRNNIDGNKAWFGAFTDRYKLILSHSDDPWLYDLEKDPDELKNFYSDLAYRETISRLATALEEYGKKTSDPWVEVPKVIADLEASENL
ncbi:MAG: sulfatase [Verrucomicrobiota bacterium]